MPACDHAAVQDGPTRRAVLATGSVLTLSACLPGADDEPTRPDPDLVLRRRAAARCGELVAAYAAVVTAFPQADAQQLGTLRSLAAEHEAHVAALAGPAPTASPTAVEPVASPSAAPVVPSTVAAALSMAGRPRAGRRPPAYPAVAAGRAGPGPAARRRSARARPPTPPCWPARPADEPAVGRRACCRRCWPPSTRWSTGTASPAPGCGGRPACARSAAGPRTGPAGTRSSSSSATWRATPVAARRGVRAARRR